MIIPKPMDSLGHAPPFPKLHESKLIASETPPIGMKIDLTRGTPGVADWKPLEQFSTARFGLLSCHILRSGASSVDQPQPADNAFASNGDNPLNFVSHSSSLFRKM